MKKHQKLILSLLTLLLIPLLFLTSCSDEKESETLHSLTVKMVNALKAGDHDTTYNLAITACTQEEFDTFYEEYESTFLEISEYELYTTDVSTEKDGGKTYEFVQYVLLSDTVNLILGASLEKGSETLSGFSAAKTDEQAATLIEMSGTVTTLSETDALQWLVLVVSLLEIAYIAWAAIDCARHKVEGKALWIVFILIGICSLTFSFGDGSFGFGFDIAFIVKYTALIGHVRELVSLRIMLPVGAVVYTIMRRRLHTPPPPPPAPVYRSYLEDDERDTVTQEPADNTDSAPEQ